MTVQEIAHRYCARFIERYGATLTPAQWSALNAMQGCRQGQYGELAWACTGCERPTYSLRSCGHRSCNQCQHHSTEQWLKRQEQKLLPVSYYMAIFTLPWQLRGLAMAHPQTVYTMLMRVATQTLQRFALNDSSLRGELGLCAVLHTHTRRLDYHPHVHVVIPGVPFIKPDANGAGLKGRTCSTARHWPKPFEAPFRAP